MERLQSEILTTSLDLDWYQTPEGQGVLAHLVDPKTESRKLYGLLERPNVPPTIKTLAYKLYLHGRCGVGKTSLVSYLSGRTDWHQRHQSETPGIRVTKIYWPARIQHRVVLFQLDVWDSGEASSKKYDHVAAACQQGSTGALLVFSFTDRSSFETIERELAARVGHPNSGATCPIVIGTKYGLTREESQVSQSDVVNLESKWDVAVSRVRHVGRGGEFPSPGDDPAKLLNMICDRLFTCYNSKK